MKMTAYFIVFCIVLLTLASANDLPRAPSSSPLVSFSAIYVFGDSLVDNGNNNYLNSYAKANYRPYGIDSSWGPTGRFSNGKNFIDLLGELLGHPYLPPFVRTEDQERSISRGVNYASAGSGILEETGLHLGQHFSFDQKVQNFKTTLNQLREQMDQNELSYYLAKSLTVVSHGSNDYVNNYLLPFYATRFIYDPKKFADILIQGYKRKILDLHGLGLRKFLLAAVGPLGCIPNQLSKYMFPPPPGQCVEDVNEMVDLFNNALRALVDELNSQNPGSIFVYGNTYGALIEMIQNPDSYGFSVVDSACCGIGSKRGLLTCLPILSFVCLNREQYVFWDAFHPSEAVNKVIARKAFNGTTSDCYPVNVSEMARM